MSLVNASYATVGGATGAIACALSSPPVAGNTLVVVVGSSTSSLSTTLSASDTLLNTFTPLTGDVTSHSLFYSTIAIFSAPVKSSGSDTVTVNFSGGTSGSRHISVLEYTGSLLLNSFNSGTGTIPLNNIPVTGTTGVFSVTQVPSTIVAGASSTDSNGFSSGAGYLLETVHAEDRTVGSTGSYTASFVFNGVGGAGTSLEWSVVAVALYRSPDQNINARSIDTLEVFGTADVRSVTNLSGINSSEVFGLQAVTQFVTLSGIDSPVAFGTLQIDPDINVTGLDSLEVFGTLSAGGTGTVNVGLVSEESFWDDNRTYWNDIGIFWDDTRSPDSTLITQETFGTGEILYTIGLTGIASREAFGASLRVDLSIGTVGNIPVTLVNPQAFWDDPITTWNDPQRWWDDTRRSQGIPTKETLGLTGFIHSSGPFGIPTQEAHGMQRLDAPAFVYISRPPSTWSDLITTWSDPTHFWGDIGTDNALPSAEAFGALGVRPTGTATVNLRPILTGEVFGRGSIDAPSDLKGKGIASAEVFGYLSVNRPAFPQLHGIVSEEVFGSMHAFEVGPTPITAARIL